MYAWKETASLLWDISMDIVCLTFSSFSLLRGLPSLDGKNDFLWEKRGKSGCTNSTKFGQTIVSILLGPLDVVIVKRMASSQKKRFIQPFDDVPYHILEEIDKHCYATIAKRRFQDISLCIKGRLHTPTRPRKC